MSNKNSAVFGLYPDESELAEAIQQLKFNGFRTTDLSVMLPENLGTKDIGHEKHTKAPEGAVIGGGAGAILGGALGWLLGAGMITIPGIDTHALVAAGPVIAMIAGIGACGVVGAFIGAFLGWFRPEYETKRYDGRIRSNAVLLSVHCDNAEWRVRAKDALRYTGAHGIGSSVESRAEFGASEKPKSRAQGNGVSRHRTFLHPLRPDSPGRAS